MRVIVAMDSMKGCLSSLEAGQALREGILRADPEAEVLVRPLADGGEGTVATLKAGLGGTIRQVRVSGHLGEPVEAEYGVLPDGVTAVLEMASAAGLTLVPPDRRDPLRTTTRGVGELLRHAIDRGCRQFLVGIGGSATNDGGAGMLRALGCRLTRPDGTDVPFGCIGLRELAFIDTSALPRGLSVTVASDVTNPLCGPDGASFVYGPQKGATYETASEMDSYLLHFASVSGFDPYEPGTGAAGGMSFALKNFFGATLKSGADIVNDLTGIASHIADSDIVITGEGRMDSQTVNGKAPYKILLLAQKYKKPVIGITGVLGDGYEKCIDAGFSKIVPLIDPTMDRDAAIASVKETVRQLFEPGNN